MGPGQRSQEAGAKEGSRREFLRAGGAAAATSALAAMAIPPVYAAEDNTIRLALIGCGGRGSGAVANAMNAPGGPVKLWAMADLFEHRLKGACDHLGRRFGKRVEVPPERGQERRAFLHGEAFRR